MTTSNEIDDHLKLALKEIGPIEPCLDPDVKDWIFSHPDYPVEYSGESHEEVIQSYPVYLREFIKHKLNDNLDPPPKKESKGQGISSYKKFKAILALVWSLRLMCGHLLTSVSIKQVLTYVK